MGNLVVTNVIITGASRGIGAGIARELADSGYNLGLMGRDKARLEALARELQDTHGDVDIYTAACDLADPAQARAAIASLSDSLGGVHALINNAGQIIRKDIWTLSDEEYDSMVAVNLGGVFHATRAVLPAMREQGGGHIINVSSISGRMPLPGGSVYAATKYAVAGFSESLLQEVREQGIKVTVIFPGSVDSGADRHEAGADHSWKLRPEDVGEACRDLLRTAPGTLISRLEIRPLNKPGK